MNSKDTLFYQKKTLNIGGLLYPLDTPKVMGIVNVTPDSFYDGGQLKSDKDLLTLAEKHLTNGADFIDVGGYSSRPGADDISDREERSRVIPAITSIKKQFPGAIISIDTFRSTVAIEALDAGASIINDISGGQMDDQMFDISAKYQAPLIIMHMVGTPETMAKNTNYDNLVLEVIAFLRKQIVKARNAGVADIIIDPGFGFSKTIEQNYLLLRRLRELLILDVPLLIGLSRKSMIYKLLECQPDEALAGTSVLNALALQNGASILRVHDVKEARDTIKLMKLYCADITV